MTSVQFARQWLKWAGFPISADDCDGSFAHNVMEIVERIASQGYTSQSLEIFTQVLHDILVGLHDQEHPVWEEYWLTEEGKVAKGILG